MTFEQEIMGLQAFDMLNFRASVHDPWRAHPVTFLAELDVYL